MRRYRTELDAARAVLAVRGLDGRLWFKLRLLASLDTLDGPDETLNVTVIESAPGRVEARCVSTRWRSRVTTVDLHDDRIEFSTRVVGEGRLLAAHLLGGWRPPYGFLPSGSGLRGVLSPNPDHPRRIVRPAVESAVIGVVGDGAEPGVGRWLFTPAPWCYAVTQEWGRVPSYAAGANKGALLAAGAGVAGIGPAPEWAGIGLAAPVAQQTFTAYHYAAGTDGFSLRLDYEGHTAVAGEFAAPTVVVTFGHDDGYAAIRAHRDLLVSRGLAPDAAERPVERHWLQPIFCGWGAQNHLARRDGGRAPDYATQRAYDGFLDHLAAHGVVPGTVVVDDKWQREYATCRPDPDKWPDLRGWIARRHARGQRVLLWWKAWDAEGAPPEACVRLPDGTPVALDPASVAGRDVIADAVRYALGPDGLDADGLKVDFTARTPSGAALRHAGGAWGAALLHRMLGIVYATAKAVKPDSLVITHAPNPAFVDVTDMLRLNDIRMLDAPDPDGPVLPHMAYRAAVVAAACPGVPVDSDGWCLPDRDTWAAYLATQPGFGVPALYYATHLDDGQPLRPEDLAAVARAWRDYRHDRGVPEVALTT